MRHQARHVTVQCCYEHTHYSTTCRTSLIACFQPRKRHSDTLTGVANLLTTAANTGYKHGVAVGTPWVTVTPDNARSQRYKLLQAMEQADGRSCRHPPKQDCQLQTAVLQGCVCSSPNLTIQPPTTHADHRTALASAGTWRCTKQQHTSQRRTIPDAHSTLNVHCQHRQAPNTALKRSLTALFQGANPKHTLGITTPKHTTDGVSQRSR